MRFFLFTPIILSICFYSITSQAEQNFKIGTFHNSIRSLILNDILSEAYSRLNIDIEITPYPARRSLLEANNGNLDGEAGRLKIIADQYPNLIMIPVPILFNQTSAFSKDPALKLQNWGDLKPYSLVSMMGLKHTEKKLASFENKLFTPTIDKAFHLVEQGRKDIAIFSLLDGLNIINHLKYQKIYAKPFEKIASYHFIHKKHKQLLPPLTKILQKMAASGELAQIAKQYKTQLESGTFFKVN